MITVMVMAIVMAVPVVVFVILVVEIGVSLRSRRHRRPIFHFESDGVELQAPANGRPLYG
jgi:hypothetical protein